MKQLLTNLKNKLEKDRMWKKMTTHSTSEAKKRQIIVASQFNGVNNSPFSEPCWENPDSHRQKKRNPLLFAIYKSLIQWIKNINVRVKPIKSTKAKKSVIKS